MNLPGMQKYRTMITTTKLHVFGLIFLCALVFFFGLGERDLWGPNEDEYAQVSQEMIELGHWISPTINKYPYTLKPILYNWIVALISLPLGRVTELTVRIPSALAGLGSVLLVYFLGKNLFGSRCGLISAIILATNIQFIHFSRWAQLYIPLTFFVILSLFLFYKGYTREGKRRSYYLWMYISMGFGGLILGPIGFVLPLLTIFVYLAAMKNLDHLKKLTPWAGSCLLLVIFLPWYIAAGIKGGSAYAHGLFIMTNLERYFSAWTHKKPIYYYLEFIGLDFLPWGLLIPAAFIFALYPRENRRRVLFPLVWFFAMFLFLSIGQGKQRGYILPLYPSLSLIIGFLLDDPIRNFNSTLWKKIVSISFLLTICLFMIVALSLPIYTKFFQKEFFTISLPLSLVVFIMSLFSLFAYPRKKTLSFFIIIFIIALSVVYFTKYAIPKIEPRESFKPFSMKIKALLGTGQDWAMYRYLRCGFIFYTGSYAKLIGHEKKLNEFLNSSKRVFVVFKEKEYNRIKDSINSTHYIVLKDKVSRQDMLLISNRR